jgi:hypothetical protein
MNIEPDIIARVSMFLPSNQGGITEEIAVEQFGCLFVVEGKYFDCRLLLKQAGESSFPGRTIKVPIKFEPITNFVQSLFHDNHRARRDAVL